MRPERTWRQTWGRKIDTAIALALLAAVWFVSLRFDELFGP